MIWGAPAVPRGTNAGRGRGAAIAGLLWAQHLHVPSKNTSDACTAWPISRSRSELCGVEHFSRAEWVLFLLKCFTRVFAGVEHETASWEQVRFSEVGGDDIATCDSSCTSCGSCLGGEAICTCRGSCDDGTSPVCQDDAAGPQCECDDGDDSIFTNFWGIFALAWVCCWIVRCARAGSCITTSSGGQVSNRFRERQIERERTETLLARAVVAAAIAQSNSAGNLQRHTPVVQAVPVSASPVAPSPAPPVNATLVTVATVDLSMEVGSSPQMAVQIAEPAPDAQELPDAGRGDGRHTLRCTHCGVQLLGPRENFCPNCGAPFGSE